jgi:hypothetical protein
MTTTAKVLGFEGGFYKIQNTPSNVKVTGAMGATGDQMKKAMEKPTITYIDKHFKPKLAKTGGAGMQQMMGGMNEAFSGITFPAKPIKVGDTWNNAIDMGQMMSGSKSTPAGVKADGKMNITYKLLKVDSSSVLIGMTISGTVNMDMSGARGAGGNGQQMKMSMTMSGGGTSSLERSTGIPLGSNTKMTMGMNFGGQPMNITQTITTKRI